MTVAALQTANAGASSIDDRCANGVSCFCLLYLFAWLSVRSLVMIAFGLYRGEYCPCSRLQASNKMRLTNIQKELCDALEPAIDGILPSILQKSSLGYGTLRQPGIRNFVMSIVSRLKRSPRCRTWLRPSTIKSQNCSCSSAVHVYSSSHCAFPSQGLEPSRCAFERC